MKGMAWSPLGMAHQMLAGAVARAGDSRAPAGCVEEKVATTCIENRKTVAW